MANTIVMAIAS